MNFRYEEIQAWIIPGFYFSIALLIMVLFWNDVFSSSIWNSFISENHGNECSFQISTPVANGLAVMLVFLIPITSLIVGWMINYLGGILLKCKILRSGAIIKGYEIIKKGDSEERGEGYKTFSIKEFERSKHLLNLKDIDRFYYRYVFSRNMFAAQIALTLIWSILDYGDSLSRYLIVLGCMILCVILFYSILCRDLCTHSRFIFGQLENSFIVIKS